MKNLASFSASALLTLGIACFAPSMLAQGNSLVASGTASSGITATPIPAPAALPPVRDYKMAVRDGILTVDGMVGKAQLNYDVNQAYLYFTVPGVGTAIVAQTHFMNSAPQKNAFHGNTLTINVNGHTVELSSNGPLVPGKTAEAWVAIDPLFGADITFPQMGFGNTQQRPFVWPGSRNSRTSSSASATAPPLPLSVRPKPEVSSSYTVTVPAADADKSK